MGKLFQYLREANLTQAQFAERIGCSQATISRFVKGQSEPSLRMARRIQNATGGVVRPGDWSGGEAEQ